MKGLGRLRRHLRHNTDIPRLRPVASVLTIVVTLFLLVFLQMEERRLSYGVLKLGRLYREKIEDRRGKEIQLARSLRLEKMEKMAARKLTLRKTVSDQVIHLNDEFLPELPPKEHLKSDLKSDLKSLTRPLWQGTKGAADKSESTEKKVSRGSESGKSGEPGKTVQ